MYFRIYCSMEIVLLVLLYFLSQKPEFTESVKPLMAQLKNSEQMLSFLNDLSRFTQTFSTLNGQPCPPAKGEKEEKGEPPNEKKEDCNTKKEEPQSPTAGIADDFIQQILEGYLKKH